MQDHAVQRRRGLVELLLERIGLGELLGGELLVQAEELVDAHVLADRRPEQLLHPVHARIGRELLQELLQLLGALLVRADLDVVQQEDLVEADLQVRDDVLAQEAR